MAIRLDVSRQPELLGVVEIAASYEAFVIVTALGVAIKDSYSLCAKDCMRLPIRLVFVRSYESSKCLCEPECPVRPSRNPSGRFHHVRLCSKQANHSSSTLAALSRL